MADQDTNREAAFVADRVTERIEHRRVVRAQPDRISEDSFQDDPHQGMNAAGVAGMTAVLQDILASLQTIEQSLNGQREETASLRAVLEANAKSEKGGMRARKEPDHSGELGQVYREHGSEWEGYPSVRRLPRRHSIEGNSKFRSLIGNASSIPRDGIIELLFGKEYLESREQSEAEKILNDIELFIEQNKNSGNFAKVWIMDFALDIDDKNVFQVDAARCQDIEGLPGILSYFKSNGSTFMPLPVSDPVSCSSMAWGRILLLEGLTAIKDCENAANSFLWYTDTDWRDIDTNRRATSVQPYDRAYTSLDHHFSCEEGFYNGRGSVLRPLFEYPFNRIQLIYFDFLHVFPSFEHWEKSYIYSTQDQAGKVFRKSCITITTYKNNAYESGADSVIVIHAPTGFMGGYISGNNNINHSGSFGPIMIPNIPGSTFDVAIIVTLLVCARNLSTHFNALLTELDKSFNSQEYITFMDPDNFVHQLYDDASFSRSRFYFWAIGCLSAFEEKITKNLRNISSFQKLYIPESEEDRYWKWKIPKEKDCLEDLDRKLKLVSQELDDVRTQLIKRLEDIKALRDGLFSASGVMESRQSRILSENVTLLTYVSIFFIPLAFCASLWSVPDINAKWPGINAPVGVAAVCGIITYLIVFNLHSIMWLGRSTLSYPRDYLVAKMEKTSTPVEDSQVKASKEPESISATTNRDPSHSGKAKWVKKAKQFEVFPRPDVPKPSDWWLAIFAVRLLGVSVFNMASNLVQKLGSSLYILKKPSSETPNTRVDIETGGTGIADSGDAGVNHSAGEKDDANVETEVVV